jgi:hypothetical protein
MKTITPIKSAETLRTFGEHFQLIVFERIVVDRAQYPDEVDKEEVVSKIFAIKDKEILKLAIESARHDTKKFVVQSVTLIDPDKIAPVHGVKFGD